MPQDVEHIGLAKELLTVILGLEPEIVDRVVRTIKDSADVYDIKTNRIRMRIGPRAMVYLRNAIEQGRHEGIETHEHGTEAEPDEEKEITGDISPQEPTPEVEPEMPEEKEMRKESITFKDFLLTEVMVDVDPSDPAGAQQQVKRAVRVAQTSPQRMSQEQRLKARADKAAAAAETGPTASLKKQIAALKERLAILQQRLAQEEQNQERA